MNNSGGADTLDDEWERRQAEQAEQLRRSLNGDVETSQPPP